MKMAYIVTLIFIALDFASGYIAAVKNKEVSSKVMREGIFHKAALIMLMVLAAAVEYAEGFVFTENPIPVEMPCCVYICIMEITSVLENICKMNPEILPEKIRAIFGAFIDTKKED